MSLQVDELQAADIDKYHCPKCEPLCGPSVMQKETNWHRNDPHDPQATHKPLQMGTKLFIEELGRMADTMGDKVNLEEKTKEDADINMYFLGLNLFN